MPQLNEDITKSPEFLQFKKDNNLEVLNGEAISVVLFALSQENKELRGAITEMCKHIDDRTSYVGDTLYENKYRYDWIH